MSECTSESLEGYDMPLHIAGLFIVLATSALGCAAPVVLPGLQDSKLLLIARHFGSGVILSTAFVHMMVPAVLMLNDPCVPIEFNENYTAYAGMFAMVAALFMQIVEYLGFSISSAAGHAHSHGGVELEANKVGHAEQKPANLGHSHSVLLSATERETLLTRRRLALYCLEFGIATHSIIIGMALGTSNEEFKTLLVAIVFHQFFEGIGLGARIRDVELPLFRSLMMVLIYTFTTPFGIALGIGIRESFNGAASTTLITQGIFDSVSAGILLYSSLVHLVYEDFVNPTFHALPHFDKMLCFGSLYVGAGIMSLIGRYA
eukprot:TRINITY_DN678_c0_g1_i2.p1 TRINITY_DN678_c0_g1~~TRINITY_DN678_c0_g1_i2.p1  ORF type:complete len:318 (-),score=60.44 TRINITY_DN678_c0_g1_i2:46-999(-)